jgi:hypothetical protein
MSLADELAGRELRTFKARPELLLQNNTVKPLHGCVPRIIMGQTWWDATRKAALALTGRRCAACGRRWASLPPEHPFLECHEVYRVNYKKGRQTYVETVPLCHACHSFIHDGRLLALRRQGEIMEIEYRKVMEHGRAVLAAAGLKRPLPKLDRKMAPWEKWRLVIDGEEFPPVYKTYADWLEKFGNGFVEEDQE